MVDAVLWLHEWVAQIPEVTLLAPILGLIVADGRLAAWAPVHDALAEALPLLDLPTDPVTVGGWNGGDAEDGAAMILAMARERSIRLSDAAMAEIEEEAHFLLRDDSRPARALGANILGHIEAIRALDAAGAAA